ncbi:MAG: hypothetical protein WC381_11390 [Kiritimatiellia bacterium]|jgi:hypothetical protein
MKDARWLVAGFVLAFALLCGIAWGAAAEHRLLGDPERVMYGNLVVGTGDLTTAAYGFNVGNLDLVGGDPSETSSFTQWWTTAGNVDYYIEFMGDITSTHNQQYKWPHDIPAGAGYALTNVGVANPIQLQWTAVPSGSFTLAGSAGSSVISSGDTLTVSAGSGILSTPVVADAVTINTVWQRAVTTISPATANDQLKVSGTFAAGDNWAAEFINLSDGIATFGGVSLSGDSSIVGVAYPGTNYGHVMGAEDGIGGCSLSETNDGHFFDTGAALDRTSEQYDAWFGDSTSAGGASRGRIKVGFVDFLESTVPDSAPNNCWRLYSTTLGLYYIDDAGNDVGPLIDASSIPSVITGTWAFGDGHDGALTKADGSTTTLTRDMYYSAVTLSANSKVNTAGYRLFCSGTITVAAGSEIYCKGGAGGNGGNAAGSTPGAAGTAGATSNAAATFHAGTAGGVGLIGGAVDNAGTIGTVGTAVTGSIYATGTSSQGGAGGNGGGGKIGGAVGSAGANTELVALAGGQLRDLMQLMTGAYLNRTAFTMGYWQSQAGSGSGGSGAGGAFMPLPSVSGAGGGSGGSGGNGGVLFIAASAITCGGSLNTNGGAGGNGGNGGNGVLGGGLGAHGGGGGGGGAGGCGGTVILVYRTLLLTGAGTCTATGGAGGALGALGTGAGIGANGANGTAGSAGDDGLVLQYVVP